MKCKLIITTLVAFLIGKMACFSQNFDSLHVYAVYMNSQYRVRMDKDLLKNEVEPFLLVDKSQIDAVYSVLKDTIKIGESGSLKKSNLDLRLLFEFYKENKVVQIIGVTPYNTMFVNSIIYTYNKENLKYLDNYITGLSKILGVKQE